MPDELFELNKDGSSLRALQVHGADKIKAGASGTIYRHPINRTKALKLYHKEERAKHKEKVELMVRVSYGRPHADQFDIAWPETLIADREGNFLGFEMPLFGNGWVDLEVLMQASQAEKDFGIGERKRLVIVKNLARAVADLHALGIYCIDLKPRNIRVNLLKLSVGLIDCDGMSVVDVGVDNSVRFHADKSTPEFWAPENLGRKPHDFINEEAHDRFALATIIFMLLNRGIHPFQGYLMSDIPGTETTVGKIKHGLYPYVPGNTKIIAHRDSLYPFWPEETKRLFDRAFTSETDRPTAEEWFTHLGQMLSDATPCPANPDHHLQLAPAGCPICARNASPRPQPPVPPSAPTTASSNTNSEAKQVLLAMGIGLFALVIAIALSLSFQQTATVVAPSASTGPAVQVPPLNPAPAAPAPEATANSGVPTYSAPTYTAPTVEFSITNNTSSTVHVAFYDGDTRNEIDPSGGRVYIQAGKATQSYRFSCTTGQLVCYGVVKAGGVFNAYWGVGYAGKQNCTGCCTYCPGSSTQVLNERDARRPTPQVTFTMTNSTSIALSAAFYSQSRHHFGWPDWDRNWTMHIGENSFTLTCQEGEKICYGAWPLGNVNGIHWGVGPNSRFGCTNCCMTCDGNTHVIPPLVIQGME